MTIDRIIRAVHAVAVDQPRMGIGEVAVVDLVGVLRQFDAFELHFAGVIENAQFDAGGVGREQGEVDPQAIPGRTEREGQSFADTRGFGTGRWSFFLGSGHKCSSNGRQ
ncbi:hypothetical protein D3C76_1118540 [compost metagenome]